MNTFKKKGISLLHKKSFYQFKNELQYKMSRFFWGSLSSTCVAPPVFFTNACQEVKGAAPGRHHQRNRLYNGNHVCHAWFFSSPWLLHTFTWIFFHFLSTVTHPFPEILKHRALDEGSSEGDDGVAIYIRLILCSASLIPAAGEDLWAETERWSIFLWLGKPSPVFPVDGRRQLANESGAPTRWPGRRVGDTAERMLLLSGCIKCVLGWNRPE